MTTPTEKLVGASIARPIYADNDCISKEAAVGDRCLSFNSNNQ